MSVRKDSRFGVSVLLLSLAIGPWQSLAQQGTTEDPSQYPGSWYRISLDLNGRYVSGDGQGYKNGTWYVYPGTGWCRQWFYNQPFNATGKGYLQYDIYISPIDAHMPTTLEINANWTTPSWSQIGVKQPPQSQDVPTAADEAKYMARSGLYRVDNQFIKPTVLSLPYTVDAYCPEWVALEIRGKNAHVYGGVLRLGSRPGACCNHETGACTQTIQSECKAPNEWLGPGTTCDKCMKGQLDFGSAPDSYKTLLADNGPRHTIVPGVFLGRTVASEPDGKPGVAVPDDDGVVFTSPLTPGLPALAEVTASVQGYLNAWVDFSQDGTFGVGTQIFRDQLLVPGVNKLAFNIPPTAVKGATYARFRFSTRGVLAATGAAPDGEVEDYQVIIGDRLEPQMNSGKGGLKWSQAPQPFDVTTPFIFNGWGQPSDLHLHQIAADDWRCDDAQPVTGFQWTGSFQNWTQPLLPHEMPIAFHIAIWTDNPATKTSSGHPDTIIWETFCTHWTWNVAGYHSDPRTAAQPPANLDTAFQFVCLLSQDQWFYPPQTTAGAQNTPTVYWLSIAALYDPNVPAPAHPWAWTTRPLFFGAGAVSIEGVEPSASWPPSLTSRYTSGRTVESPQGTGWDYAFELLTNQAAPGRDPALASVYRLRSDQPGGYACTTREDEKPRLLNVPAQRWTLDRIARCAFE